MILCEDIQEKKENHKHTTTSDFSLRNRFPERYELLFQAALLKGEPAVKAWDSYRANQSLPEIEKDFENEPYLLLPLLYRNLEDHGQGEKLPAKYAGVYRYTWTRNQNLIRNAAQTIELFLKAGIETMILKGAALSVTHYQDFGVRRLQDVDVSVKPEKLESAIHVLEKNGWTLRTSSHLNREFENSAGNRLDLHWFVGADDWKRAMPVTIQDVPAWTLNPTDHLNFICGIYKWHALLVADAFMLINHSSYSIDWDRLIKNRKGSAHLFALRALLHYLSIVLEANIPANILTHLENQKIDRRGLLYFAAVACPAKANSEGPFARLKELWVYYCESFPRKNFFSRIIEFPLYLRYRWHLNRWWKFPFSAASKLMARLPKLSCTAK